VPVRRAAVTIEEYLEEPYWEDAPNAPRPKLAASCPRCEMAALVKRFGGSGQPIDVGPLATVQDELSKLAAQGFPGLASLLAEKLKVGPRAADPRLIRLDTVGAGAGALGLDWRGPGL